MIPKISKMIPRAKRNPKGSQLEKKGSRLEPKGSQLTPKGDPGVSENDPGSPKADLGGPKGDPEDPNWQVVAVPISLCILYKDYYKKADGYRSVPTQSGERYPSPCANLMYGFIYNFEKAAKTNRTKVGTTSDRGTHLTLHIIRGLL